MIVDELRNRWLGSDVGTPRAGSSTDADVRRRDQSTVNRRPFAGFNIAYASTNIDLEPETERATAGVGSKLYDLAAGVRGREWKPLKTNVVHCPRR